MSKLAIRAVRERIRSIKSIQHVTRTMRMVSAVKIKRAQEAINKARPYSDYLENMIQHLLPHIDRSLHPLLLTREPINIGYVIVTSDHGLCAGFNSSIIETALNEFSNIPKESLSLICVGKFGRDYFLRRGYNVIGEYIRFFEELGFQHAIEVAKVVMDLFMLFELDQIKLIFNSYKSVYEYETTIQQYLPLILESKNATLNEEILIEPSKDEIIKSLLPLYLNVRMWRNLLESYAAEQSSRMIAMEKATESAEELIEHLTLEYNKVRQSLITGEILEVIEGLEAEKS